jgi:redox-sensitive bicupin YhaK (pirin superfamily)
VATAPGLLEIVAPREASLGPGGGLSVRRTLPTRQRSLIGAWCFVDHYGPADVATDGMQVLPHPHVGLQTLSWLFEGEVEHRDSAGNRALIRPGEVNLMTAGRGISHSETSTTSRPVLHGLQLWVALPQATRFADPGFTHHEPTVLHEPGLRARVLVGELFSSRSPVEAHSPLLGAELDLDAGTCLDIPLARGFEHGILVDSGAVRIDGSPVPRGHLAHLPLGQASIRIEALTPARLMLLGGEPLGEPIVMWWNFVGRSHDEIAAFRAQWQLEISGRSSTIEFGLPITDPRTPLDAPPLPPVRLKPRG